MLEVAEQQARRGRSRLGGLRGDRVGEGGRGVHDDLVVEEEDEVRSGDEGAGPAEAPEPVAQVGDPAQRPLRAGALHDEVAGEAAVRAPEAGLAVGIGRRVVGVAVPRVAQVRRPTPQQRAHHLAPLTGTGRLLDETEGAAGSAG